GIGIGTSGANAAGESAGAPASAASSPGSVDNSGPSLGSSAPASSGPTEPTAARRFRSTGAGFERQLRGAVVSHRLDILYLSFTLAFVGLCIGARLLGRARQPVRSLGAHGG